MSLRIPATNVYAKGGYTARLLVGANHQPVNLILDTGSSTLAIKPECYVSGADSQFSTTPLAQSVRYGKGGWYGPVIKTGMTIGMAGHRKELTDIEVALTYGLEAGSFADADGIVGLAYAALDIAHDMSDILSAQDIDPPSSYPYVTQTRWSSVEDFSRDVQHCPTTTVTPLFTQIESQGGVANQFALYTHRSSILHSDSHCPVTRMHSHYLNQGLFIVGKPRIHQDLYLGEPQTVKLVHDKYYNVNVRGIRIGSGPVINAPALEPEHLQAFKSNGIVDSGASYVVLPKILFQSVIEALVEFNPSFEDLLKPFGQFTGKETGIPLSALRLEHWPQISLVLEGDSGEDVPISLSPETYWQIHAPRPDEATFKLCYLPNWPSQLILGLPLLNNYYTIFDRAASELGVIQFAQKSNPGQALSHALGRTLFHGNQ